MADPTVDWSTRVITVPQSYLTPLGDTAYSLDTNAFRLALKDIEDDEGIGFPDTHRHNTQVVLGGVTYARFLEIINDYTVTFEDGVYAVVLLGSNNNILDVTNLNSVSVRSSNSAGLIVSGSGVTAQDKTDIIGGAAEAVWTEDERTLTSAAGTTPAEIWGHTNRTLTQSANQVADAVSGSVITVKNYTTWKFTLTGIGDVSQRAKLYFTAKQDYNSDTDARAIIHIEEDDGLLYINGAVAADPDMGSMVVTDEDTGIVAITIDASVTGITPKVGRYGIKMITESGVQYMIEGEFKIEYPVARAIT